MGRQWKSVTSADILLFLASIVCMSVVSLGTKSQTFEGSLHELGFLRHHLLSACDMRLKPRRICMPLFQFLLDVPLENTILLSREVHLSGSKSTAEIRISIARDLVMESREMRASVQRRVPSPASPARRGRQRGRRVRSVVPERRIDPGMHSVLRETKRSRCCLCNLPLLAVR